MHPAGPRPVSQEVVEPDRLSLREDLSHLNELLSAEPESLNYVAPFLQGLARLSGDASLKKASDALSEAFSKGKDMTQPIEKIRDVIRARLAVSEPV